MMQRLSQPQLIGLLLVGIVFNFVLGILGWLGFALLDALWITAALLTIIGAAVVQGWIEQQGQQGEGD